MKNVTSPPPAQSAIPSVPVRNPGLAGAVSVGVALALTELAAGLTDWVPSSVAAVGAFVVDRSPPVVKDVAISLLGTADKGALAIGITVVALVIGAIVGRLSVRRPWVGGAAFAVFGVAGAIAGASEPLINPVATILVVAASVFVGFVLLRLLLGMRESDEPADGGAPDQTRRRFLTTVAGLGAAAIIGGAVGRAMIIRRSEAVRSTMKTPEPVRRVLAPTAANSFDVPGLAPIVVPNSEFYRIDTALIVPRVDPESWRLEVTGMVDQELELTYADLQNMDLYEQYVTISCVSNSVGGGLVGNAVWRGVRLVDVLDQAGVQPGATQIVGRSVDGWTAGFPTELAFDGRDPLIALAMNGDPLPANHGFPARLIVPGLYGYVSATKWLTEINLTTWEAFDAYWIPRGWSKEGPIKTQSRIDRPRLGETIPAAAGVVAGVAWAPLRGISKVEVQLDDGPWIEAELTEPLSDAAWVQWRAEFTPEPGDHEVRVRATDGTGATQTDVTTSARPNGATGWHHISFRAA